MSLEFLIQEEIIHALERKEKFRTTIAEVYFPRTGKPWEFELNYGIKLDMLEPDQRITGRITRDFEIEFDERKEVKPMKLQSIFTNLIIKKIERIERRKYQDGFKISGMDIKYVEGFKDRVEFVCNFDNIMNSFHYDIEGEIGLDGEIVFSNVNITD